MDLQSNLLEYQVQLEQVEIALKNDPDNEDILKLKNDLVEVINMTKEMMGETEEEGVGGGEPDVSGNVTGVPKSAKWKSGDKCMAIWHEDGQYYPAVIDQIIEGGACTVTFEGYSKVEMTQVSLLKARNKNASNADGSSLLNKNAAKSGSMLGKKPMSRRELEQKLRDAKKRKREKFEIKLKQMDEISEKDKNKWKSFNTKLASKTWKGVVKKNKFELPAHHESKIGVGVNSLLNRPSTANSSASAAAAQIQGTKKMKHS